MANHKKQLNYLKDKLVEFRTLMADDMMLAKKNKQPNLAMRFDEYWTHINAILAHSTRIK